MNSLLTDDRLRASCNYLFRQTLGVPVCHHFQDVAKFHIFFHYVHQTTPNWVITPITLSILS